MPSMDYNVSASIFFNALSTAHPSVIPSAGFTTTGPPSPTLPGAAISSSIAWQSLSKELFFFMVELSPGTEIVLF
nr:hypothetical protein CFP56_79263 [Quercus suber]